VACVPQMIHAHPHPFWWNDTKYQRQIQFNAVLSMTKQWMQSEITFYQLKGHQCVTVTSHWHAQKMQHFSAKSELIVFVSSFSIYTLLISLNKANTGCERQPISFLIYDKSCIGSKSAVTWPQWHMCDIKVQ
jgi:hypothetical protein